MKFQHTTPMSLGSGPLGIGQLDPILNSNFAGTFVTQTWSVPGYQIKNSYSAIVVVVTGLSGGSLPLCATVANDWNVARAPRYCAPFKAMPELTTTWQAIIPANITPGKAVGGTIYLSIASSVTSILVYGATQQTPFPMMRADGRAYPIASQYAQANSSTAGSTQITTPSIGQCRLMVKSLFLAAGVATTNVSVQIQATINGVTTAVMFMYAGTGLLPAINMVWDDGLLLDVGTALQLTLAAGTYSLASLAVVTFDQVV